MRKTIVAVTMATLLLPGLSRGSSANIPPLPLPGGIARQVPFGFTACSAQVRADRAQPTTDPALRACTFPYVGPNMSLGGSGTAANDIGGKCLVPGRICSGSFVRASITLTLIAGESIVATCSASGVGFIAVGRIQGPAAASCSRTARIALPPGTLLTCLAFIQPSEAATDLIARADCTSLRLNK